MRNEFELFGSLEKIEIFSKENEKFAHITYKDSRQAYFAIFYLEQTEPKWLLSIKPASIHKQPNWNVSKSFPSMLKLSDDCLEEIFKIFNVHEQALLSIVCERFRKVLKERIFLRKNIITFTGNNPLEGIVTACRLIQSIKPNHFELTFKPVNLASQIHIYYRIQIKLNNTGTIFNVHEYYFYQYIHHFESILKRFNILNMILSHKARNSYSTITSSKIFESVGLFVIKGLGIEKPIPKITKLNWLPRLTAIRIENGYIDEVKLSEYLKSSEKLDRFEIFNCSVYSDKMFFDNLINKNDIRSITIYYNEITFKNTLIGGMEGVIEVKVICTYIFVIFENHFKLFAFIFYSQKYNSSATHIALLI